MRRFARITGVVLLSVVALVLVISIGGWCYLRSQRGTERVVRYALSKLDRVFPGGVRVGRIEGDLTTGVSLTDFAIRDREGKDAIHVDQLVVTYELPALLRHHVHVTYLGLWGATVVSRKMADGRDDLGALAADDLHPQHPLRSPVSVALDALDLEGRFIRDDERLRLTAHGAATLSTTMDLFVEQLAIAVGVPGRGSLIAHGGLSFGDRLVFHHAVARLDSEGRAVERYVPELVRLGQLGLVVTTDGTLDELTGSVDAHALGAHLATRVVLDTHAIALDRVTLTAPFGDLHGDGRVAFDGDFDARGHVEVRDLSALARFGAPNLRGKVILDGSVARARTFVLKLSGRADELDLGRTFVRDVRYELDSVDLAGHAQVTARGLRIGNVALDDLRVHGKSDGERFELGLAGSGRDASAEIALTGRTTRSAGRLRGAEAQLRTLLVIIAGEAWRAQRPAALAIDVDRRALRLERLDLASDDGESIALEAQAHDQTIDRALVEVKHFDFARLAPLLSPGHALPRTDLYARVSAHGPVARPDVDAHLSGEAHGRGERDTIHLSGSADARLSGGRVTGQTFLTIGGQKANAHVDAPFPLRPNAPIYASVDASVLLSPTFSELLVPKLIQFQPLVMFALSGTVTAHAQLTGTTSAPVLHATGRLRRWEAAGARGEIGLSIESVARALRISTKTELSSVGGGAGSGGGIIEATGELPLDLSAWLDGGSRDALDRAAQIHAAVDLHHVGIDYMPLRAFSVASPLLHGTVDAHAELAGSLSLPRLTARLDARDFELRGTGLNGLGLRATASVEGRALTTKGALFVDRREAFTFGGSLDAGHRGSPTSIDWSRAVLALHAHAEHFDLGGVRLLRDLGGILRADVTLSGSPHQPTGRLDAQITDLQTGSARFRGFSAWGRLSAGELSGAVTAQQAGGASLAIDGRVGLDGSALSARLQAHRFTVDLEGDGVPALRTLRGTVEGQLRAAGASDDPTLDGKLQIERGELRTPDSAISYHDVDATLSFDAHEVRIAHAKMRAGQEGDAAVDARFVLDHRRPSDLEATLVLHRFPFQEQGFGALLDATVVARGKRDAAGMLAGTLTVRSGGLELPPLDRSRALLPMGALEDVHVVDSKHRPTRGGVLVGALLEGPFHIHGHEIDAVARGGLTLDLSGAHPALRGTLRTDPGAWVELFGRRYDLDTGRVRFTGESAPELDLRLTRKVTGSIIGVDVRGAAIAPTLRFWADPPIYDRAQIAGLVLAGDPNTTRISTTTLERNAVGAASSLVVRSLEQGLARELPIEVGKFVTPSFYIGYAYVGDASADGLDLHFSWRPAH